jgi:hypothetical protein
MEASFDFVSVDPDGHNTLGSASNGRKSLPHGKKHV